MEARPKAVAAARDAVNWTMTLLETWATERPEVTAEERNKVAEMCANFTEWLDGVEEEQEKLPLTAPPAFLSSALDKVGPSPHVHPNTGRVPSHLLPLGSLTLPALFADKRSNHVALLSAPLASDPLASYPLTS